MDKWKPDRSGKYLTVVYRDVDIGDEVLEITKHEKSCAMSWSHALWDVDYLKNCIKPKQRTWVGLMRGVRVEGDTVVISVKGGNEAARELCGELINEMNT